MAPAKGDDEKVNLVDFFSEPYKSKSEAFIKKVLYENDFITSDHTMSEVRKYLDDNHYLKQDLTLKDVNVLRTVLQECAKDLIINHINTCNKASQAVDAHMHACDKGMDNLIDHEDNCDKGRPHYTEDSDGKNGLSKVNEWLKFILMIITLVGFISGWAIWVNNVSKESSVPIPAGQQP